MTNIDKGDLIDLPKGSVFLHEGRTLKTTSRITVVCAETVASSAIEGAPLLIGSRYYHHQYKMWFTLHYIFERENNCKFVQCTDDNGTKHTFRLEFFTEEFSLET